MRPLIRFLALLLCVVTVLMGCQRTTTVILPPETAPTAASGEISSTAATEPSSLTDTEPTTSRSADPTESVTGDPTNAPTTAPATTPSVSPSTEPSTVPTARPTEAPTVTPTTEPTTKPIAVPTTESTTAPTTGPTTAPTTEPTTAPTTEPTTTATTEPTTAPTSEPTTAPTTEPPAEPTTEPAEPTQHPVYDISSHTVGTLEYGLLSAINDQRAAAELPGLTMDHTLCALGAIRAYECTESFSHTRPDGRGAFTVLSDYGYYIWSHLNERIHHGTSGLSAGTIVKGWMYTADFSANILSADFTHIGIGVYDNGGTTYIVCFFAG